LGRRQNENTLQREIVKYINETPQLGAYVSRIKNMGTFDPNGGFFRKNGTEKGIPDIIGVKQGGRAIFIEVKMPTNDGRCRPLSKEQVEYLMRCHEMGAIVGVAYDVSDAFDIVADHPTKYPRKDRTYGNRKLRAVLAKGTPHEIKYLRSKNRDPLRDCGIGVYDDRPDPNAEDADA
jgi:hypothetical protein